MQLRNRVALPIALSTLLFLVGCGSSSNKVTPPPGGGFDNTNMNGTYVFSTLGTDSGGYPISIAGAFTACGCSGGTISGGTFTFNDGQVGVVSAQTISGGSYNVTADGRGQAHLSNSTILGTVTLDFVLASTNGGSVTEYDTNGTGSGTLELQSSVSQSDLANSYAFLISGVGSNGLFATAGAMTLDANGDATTGLQDVTSLNTTTGIASSQTGLSISTSSSVLVGTGTAPGTAQISSAAGLFTFDVYPVDATHLKFVETDGLIYGAGDVFTQQSALPSGTIAFTMAGADTTLLPLAVGGLLPSSSGTISSGIEDYNDGGVANSATNVSGGFTSLSGGRALLTLNGFENGATNNVLGNYAFAAYPSTGGTFLLEIDDGGITAGIALAQSTTSFAATQGYGMNLSAINLSGSTPFEEDDIAEFTSTSSALNGLIDFNDEGTITFGQTFNASYTSLSTGRYQLTSNDLNGVFYTVDGTSVLFLETDDLQVGGGSFLAQSATTSQMGALARRSAIARVPVFRAGLRQKRARAK